MNTGSSSEEPKQDVPAQTPANNGMDTQAISVTGPETVTSGETVQLSLSGSGAQQKRDVPMVDSSAAPTEAELEGLRQNLITAIEKPDLSRFEELLTHKGAIDINLDYRFPDESVDNTGLSLLILASALGKEPIVDYLLDDGRIDVKLGASYPDGWTALHMAAWGGHDRVIKKLLTKIADIDSANDDGDTALHCACKYGRLEVAIMLIKKGANVHSKSERGYTPLHYACRSGHEEVAEMLIQEKAEIDAESATGNTPLHLACLHDQLKIAKMLIDKGAKINRPTENKYTPLHNACWEGYLDMVQMLIKNKADVHLTDEDGWNALHFASMIANDSVLRHLLSLTGEMKLDRNRQSTTGITPLMVAIDWGSENCANALLGDDSVDLSLRAERGDTALAFAAREGQWHVVQKILESKTYFPDNLIEEKACTASPYELEQIEEDLLKLLENDSICDGWSNKVMMWAVVNGSVKVMNKCGDKFPDAKSSPDGRTTWLHLASKYGRQALIDVLKQWGTDVNAATAQGKTPLDLAAEGGHIMTVQKLLPTNNNKDSSTPASNEQRFLESTKLIDMILTRDGNQDNAITLAGKSNHREICDILWAELSNRISENKSAFDNFSGDKKHLVEIAAQYGTPGKEEIVKTILQHNKAPEEDQKHWTTLHWVIFESRVVPTWWLLSNGAHLKSSEISMAQDILTKKSKDDSTRTDESTRNLMGELLKNPPMVKDPPPPTNDTYHVPQFPVWTGEKPKALKSESIIVDFHCRDDGVDFQLKRRPMKDVIYEVNKGPNGIMKENDLNEFAEFKIRLEELKKAKESSSSADLTQPLGPDTDRHTETKSPDPKPTAPMKQPSNKVPGQTDQPLLKEHNSKSKAEEEEKQKQQKFRWIHVRATCRKVIEVGLLALCARQPDGCLLVKQHQHLMTRIAMDSKKTQQDLDSILGYLKRSWIEVPAGGVHIKENGKCWSDKKDQTLAKKATASDIKPDTPQSAETAQQTNKNPKSQARIRNKLISLYMPFLTVSEKDLEQGQDTHDQEREKPRQHKQHKAIYMHEPMTLHEYYYTTIVNSVSRDRKQVLRKYLPRVSSKENMKKPNQEQFSHTTDATRFDQEQFSNTKGLGKSDQEQIAKKTKGRGLLHWLPWVQRPSAPTTEGTQDKSFIYTVDQLWLWIVNDGKC
ncbi:hypothetical protein ACMYSQ_005056 [Aspergillus niger]